MVLLNLIDTKNSRQATRKNVYNKTRYQSKKEEILNKNKIRYEKNKVRVLAAAREYKLEHRDEIKARSKSYASENKERIDTYLTGYRERNRDMLLARGRKNTLKKVYGLTPEDFDRMAANQNGLCAICGGPPEKSKNKLDIDHDHITGKVRGLLCGSCNKGLGMFKDDDDLVFLAAQYLRKNKGL